MIKTELCIHNGLDKKTYFEIIKGVKKFIQKCKKDKTTYSLSPKTDSSPFTICFYILLKNFISKNPFTQNEKNIFIKKVKQNIFLVFNQRKKQFKLEYDKHFLQLLTFSLSSLYILGGLNSPDLNKLVKDLIPPDIKKYLLEISALKGKPQSGNLSMCIAILLIYLREYCNINVDQKIANWTNCHLQALNNFGFWSGYNKTHLQFQNGYHQYEIFEYLDVSNPKLNNAVDFIRGISDQRGQFAPYFGGSGCYDYDAISILTGFKRVISNQDKKLMIKTAETILKERNLDGGFSESKWIRPRNLQNIVLGLNHVFKAKGLAKYERLRYFIALNKNKNNLMNTHWTNLSREWSESNLWDTWFRLMTIAKIDISLNPRNFSRWNFINFPGIGFYK